MKRRASRLGFVGALIITPRAPVRPQSNDLTRSDERGGLSDLRYVGFKTIA